MDERQHQPDQPTDLDAALTRGLTEPRYTRGQVLRAAGGGLGALSFGALLSACGVKGTASKTTTTAFDWNAWWKKQHSTGHARLRQLAALHRHATRQGSPDAARSSRSQTGIKVDLLGGHPGQRPFFAKILRPRSRRVSRSATTSS